MRLILFILFLALTSSFETPAFAQALERPFEKAAYDFHMLLVQREFAQLENIAEIARTRRTTLSDGQPVLAALYSGVAGCLTNGCANGLGEAEWQNRHRLLMQWRQAAPQSVTAEIALAQYFIESGWAIRGSGAAQSVKPAAWPAFHKNMTRASALLQGATSAAKDDPGWYAGMLMVGLAEGWKPDRIMQIYKQGAASYAWYLPIHFNASAYFSPRWYGSPLQLRRFVKDAVKITETQFGPSLYARLNWSLWTPGMFSDGQTSWQLMRAGFQRLTSDHPDQWNYSHFAKFACIAGDRETLRDTAKKLTGQPIERAWGTLEYYRQCLDYAGLA